MILSIEELKKDRAEYLEKMVDQHSVFQQLQAKAREAEIALYHMQGAFSYIEENIKRLEDSVEEATNAK